MLSEKVIERSRKLMIPTILAESTFDSLVQSGDYENMTIVIDKIYAILMETIAIGKSKSLYFKTDKCGFASRVLIAAANRMLDSKKSVIYLDLKHFERNLRWLGGGKRAKTQFIKKFTETDILLIDRCDLYLDLKKETLKMLELILEKRNKYRTPFIVTGVNDKAGLFDILGGAGNIIGNCEIAYE